MATLNWREELPSNDSLVGRGAGDIRDQWAQLTSGMAESLQWPSGLRKPGSFASYDATDSTFSAEGMLHINSALSRLLYHASALSFTSPAQFDIRTQMLPLGNATFVEHATEPRGVWLQVSGLSAIAAAADDEYDFSYSTDGVSGTQVIFGAPPNIYLTSGNTGVSFSVSTWTTGGFSVRAHEIIGTTSDWTLHWLSSGTTGAFYA